MQKFVGIDLGTTNSCISFYRKAETATKGAPNIIPLDGSATIQSCVMLKNGEFIVGKEAYQNRYSPSAIYSVKRLMGTKELITLTDAVTGEELSLTPAQLSAEILKAIKRKAETYIGEIKNVTITVPAYFTPNQKQDTMEAGHLAGFEEITMINEPTSASLAYQLDLNEPETVMIFDLGGGTFDVSIVQISPAIDDSDSPKDSNDTFLADFYGISADEKNAIGSKGTVIKVLESDGDNKLGGDDVDYNILRHLIFGESRTSNKFDDIMENDILREELLLKIEGYKKLNMGGSIPVSEGRSITITTKDIEFGYKKVLNKCMKLARPLIDKYKDSLSKIILVGGSTKSPYVKEYLQNQVSGLGIKVYSDLNPDEAVGLGASVNSAIRASSLSDVKLFDTLPESISIEVENGKLVTILDKGSLLPATDSHPIEITEGFNVANIKVYMGSGYVDSPNVHFLGYVQLKPEDSHEAIKLQMTVDLDSILHIRAVSKTANVEKKLVNVSNLSATESKGINQVIPKAHSRRIANISQMLVEAKDIPNLFKPAYLANISDLVNQYKNADDFDKFYQENKKAFQKFSTKYSKYLVETSTNKLLIAQGTVAETGDVRQQAEGYDTGDTYDLSNRFQ